MKVITTNLLNRLWQNGIKPIKTALDGKISTSKIVKSTNITQEGFLMDGKTASEKFAELNSNKIEILQKTFTEEISSTGNIPLYLPSTEYVVVAVSIRGAAAIPYVSNSSPFNWNSKVVTTAPGAPAASGTISGTVYYCKA